MTSDDKSPERSARTMHDPSPWLGGRCEVHADGSYVQEMDAVSAYPRSMDLTTRVQIQKAIAQGREGCSDRSAAPSIDPSALANIQKVIAHGREGGPCADGLAAALIVRNAVPEVPVEFVRYESPQLRDLNVEPGLLFVDITPPADRAAEFLAAGALVFDHHATMEHVTRLFEKASQGVYAAPEERGVSAAMLAYREVWRPLMEMRFQGSDDRTFGSWVSDVAHFADLAGIYDTWKRDDPLWSTACELTAALYFFPVDEWLAMKDLSFSRGADLERKMSFGRALIRDRQARARDLVAGADRYTTPKGTRVAVCSSAEISEAAELFEDVDVVVGFTFRVREGRPSIKLSFRSRGSYEVRAMAEALGGGGHAHAASVWLGLERSVAYAHPYNEVYAVVSAWEEGRLEEWRERFL